MIFYQCFIYFWSFYCNGTFPFLPIHSCQYGLGNFFFTEWVAIYYYSFILTLKIFPNLARGSSCLENPRDGEACWATVYGVAQSQTRLKWRSSSSSSSSSSSVTCWWNRVWPCGAPRRRRLSVPHFLVGVNRLQPSWPSLSSKGYIQTVASQGRSSQETT